MFLYRKCHGDHLICNHLVTKCSFHHTVTEATKQKTDLAIVVEEFALMIKMPCRPVNLESFGHNMFISSQQFL